MVRGSLVCADTQEGRMRLRYLAEVLAAALLICSTPVHAECVKAGETVQGVTGKLLYGRATIEPGQTFPATVQRGRAGNYYLRPAELMCLDQPDGEGPGKVDYLWIDILRLGDAERENMQGWIGAVVAVEGVLSMQTFRTGASARINATAVVRQ
jgi:hypothetical protein